jgi:hypothetical protein
MQGKCVGEECDGWAEEEEWDCELPRAYKQKQ